MRAIVCAAPGPISVLKMQEIPMPMPDPGQVLIKILGFGINRAGKASMRSCLPYLSLRVFPLTDHITRNVHACGPLSNFLP